MKGRARRKLFTLLWGKGNSGNVSSLAREAMLGFSTTHSELEAMRAAGLAATKRVGTELQYHADAEHPEAALLRRLAQLPVGLARKTRPGDDEVRTWLANTGAPVGVVDRGVMTPPPEKVVAEALALAHRDATVARALPVVLWRLRKQVDVELLRKEAMVRDEKQALGYFMELAGLLGRDRELRRTARSLKDSRRKRPRMFFTGQLGKYELALTRRNTPNTARRWGYLMNMSVESFRSTFDSFAR